MITHKFDYGWGPELLTKRLEAEILQQYLRPFSEDASATVLINNTWYSDQSHQKTVQELQKIRPDRIVLVSMIDAANSWPERFSEFAREVRCVGYYGPPDDIDFWALAVDRWLQVSEQDLLESSTIDTAYMCLNRKPHFHRQQLYDALVASGVVNQGLVSMGSKIDSEPAQRVLDLDTGVSALDLNPNPGVEQTGIVNDIMSLGHPANWRRIFLNVITETQFNLRKTKFVSEKIYKPIVGCRPFLVYARDGAIPWLTQRGFEPYVNDFRDITDLDLSSYHSMVPFLQVLCQQPSSYWQKRMVDLRPKLLYNRNRFNQYVREIQDKITKGIQCQI